MNGTSDSSDRASTRNSAPVTPQRLLVLDTAQLFDGRDEIRLLHRGQEYRLRVTRQGKLILTK